MFSCVVNVPVHCGCRSHCVIAPTSSASPSYHVVHFLTINLSHLACVVNYVCSLKPFLFLYLGSNLVCATLDYLEMTWCTTKTKLCLPAHQLCIISQCCPCRLDAHEVGSYEMDSPLSAAVNLHAAYHTPSSSLSSSFNRSFHE
jgi:hypothetical protein